MKKTISQNDITKLRRYLFQTEYFRITDFELELVRGGFCFKTIPLSEIKKLKISRSSRVKRPFLVFLFGLLLLTPVFYMLYYGQGYFINFIREMDAPIPVVRSFKFLGYLLLSVGIFIALAVMSFRLVLVPELVMRCEMKDDSFEVFDLKALSAQHQIYELMQFLRGKFKEDQLDFTMEIL